MYGSEEEVNVKRRKMVLIAVIVFVLILIVLLIIAIKSKKSSNGGDLKELTCELQAVSLEGQDANGVYNDEVEIVFKTINKVSDKYDLVKQKIGISDNSSNKETFKIIRSGNYKVHGYLEDSEGNVGTCEIEVTVSISEPTCELEATSKDFGENGWYLGDVEVSFKDRSTNNPSTMISKYYIEKNGVTVDINNISNKDSYLINQDGETQLVGYVMDNSGKTGTCNITVKKDSVPPTCTLKVTSGTLNGSGAYIDNPIIEFNTVQDNTQDVTNMGIGLEKNYTNSKYTLDKNGTYTIYGYVKDVAGNETVCSLQVTRNNGSGIDSKGTPSCLLYIEAAKYQLEDPRAYAMYKNGLNNVVKVIMSTSENTASYGMGTTEVYNGQKEYVIKTPGTYTITGYVKSASGEKSYCVTPQFIVKGSVLGNNVSVGDYVNYEMSYNAAKCDTNDVQGKNGWRVIDVKSTGEVVIVSTGAVECVTHGTSSQTTIDTMKNISAKYLNSKYADKAEPLNCNSPNINGCQYALSDSDLYKTSNYYLLATEASGTELWAINPSGIPEKVKDKKYGMRVVVTLSPYTLTTGKSNGVWTLTR